MSPPDGYTIAVTSIANAVQPALYKLPYDPHKAFDAVAMFVTSPNTLAVHPELPAKDLKEFIALAKSKPGDIQYASGGIGGSLHTGMELFKLIAKIDLLHVPFRGAGPAGIDVIAGNTKAMMATASSVTAHIRGGKLRGLCDQHGQAHQGVCPTCRPSARRGCPNTRAATGSVFRFRPERRSRSSRCFTRRFRRSRTCRRSRSSSRTAAPSSRR